MINAHFDPKGLIREAYCIEGITLGECRSIFLDWALSLANDVDAHDAIREGLEAYGQGKDDHPMTSVLNDGLVKAPTVRRRGGRKGRLTPT